MHLLDAALLDGEKLQQIGQRGGFIHLDDLEPLVTFSLICWICIVVLDLEVGLQNIDDGMIGCIPAVGEAFAFQEGDILVGDSLPELIEES